MVVDEMADARRAPGRALRRSRRRVGHGERAGQLSARRLRRRPVPARRKLALDDIPTVHRRRAQLHRGARAHVQGDQGGRHHRRRRRRRGRARGLEPRTAAWVEPRAANQPSRPIPSTSPRAIASCASISTSFVDSSDTGTFDSDLDGKLDEPHPKWKDTLDWLGVQYYSRRRHRHARALPRGERHALLQAARRRRLPAAARSDVLRPADGLRVGRRGSTTCSADFGKRCPTLPLVVTESGIATDVGARRAEKIVRVLEQIDAPATRASTCAAITTGASTTTSSGPKGFGPRFGLYSVDFNTLRAHADRGRRDLLGDRRARICSRRATRRRAATGP